MRRRQNKPITIVQANPASPLSEIYRNLRFKLDFAVFDQGLKTIAITSANRGEGKTTTAVNLAEAFAENGKQVLLMDANLREPAVHHAYQLKNKRGLAQSLEGEPELVINTTHLPQLSVLTAGATTNLLSELFKPEKLQSLLDHLKSEYDIIIIDTPPILHLSDAKMLAAGSDGVLLVVEHGKLKRSIAQKVQEDLLLMKANLLGIVMNKINRKEARSER